MTLALAISPSLADRRDQRSNATGIRNVAPCQRNDCREVRMLYTQQLKCAMLKTTVRCRALSDAHALRIAVWAIIRAVW